MYQKALDILYSRSALTIMRLSGTWRYWQAAVVFCKARR
jgi:hypothetical protein